MQTAKKVAVIAGAVFLVEFAAEKGVLNSIPAAYQKYAKAAAIGGVSLFALKMFA